MSIDWSILQQNAPVDIAGNFARGYQMGEQISNRFHQNNALAALAQNPDDNAAFTMLYQVNPELASNLETRREARQKFVDAQTEKSRRAALGTQYAGGDTTGAEKAAVSQGDFDVAAEFSKLDTATQQKAAAFWEKAGPIAYQLKQTKDPAQRQALWAQAKPILQSEGIDSAQLNQFDPTNDAQLDAAITTSQKVSDLVNQNKIEWHQQGENPSFATDSMGHPIGSANPATIGSLPTVSDQKSYDAVPPGGHYLDPSGHMRVKGGQTATPSGGFPVNNPGALRVPGSTQFQHFATPQQGVQAQVSLLAGHKYLGGGNNTVRGVVETYAPRISHGGDNTDAQVNNYIAYVSHRLGVNPDQPISDVSQLAQAMREFETGQRAD